MANTTITICMDEKLKKQAETLFEDMGLNMTTAFTIFTKAVIREGKLPFEIPADPFYSELNQTRLLKAIDDLNNGKSEIHDLLEVDDE